MPGSVRQWTLVALVKKTSLHLTVWRQLTDWREQVTTWRDLRGLLYSHSDIVCLLIQSNCITLQTSINVWIWVAWLFDDPVQVILFSQRTVGNSDFEIKKILNFEMERTWRFAYTYGPYALTGEDAFKYKPNICIIIKDLVKYNCSSACFMCVCM
jgi:hypothetical protein